MPSALDYLYSPIASGGTYNYFLRGQSLAGDALRDAYGYVQKGQDAVGSALSNMHKYYQSGLDFVRSGQDPSVLLDKLSGSGVGSAPGSISSGAGGTSGAYGYSPSAAQLDYAYADLAKHYGLDKATAYQEALSNTGYQRAVADMKAAGLNPAVLFGSGRVSPASGVGYVSSGAGGSSGRYGSGSAKLFSTSAYGAITNLAGLAGLALSKGRYTGYLAGSTAAKGVLSLFDAVF